jgi:hypothetical protein
VRKLVHKLVAQGALALGVISYGLGPMVMAQEPISFVLPAANFQPVAADAYPTDNTPPDPPVADEALTPPPTPPTPTEMVSPDASDSQNYISPEALQSLDCPNCEGGNGGCLPPGRLPNGQYPDDWMWGCGGWPYANGPGTCDDWKVGPIWDVTVDGMVMTRPNTNLDALENAMPDRPFGPVPPGSVLTPDVREQFDRGPGGRVYLTGLVPRNVGYQVFAGYEGIEEWNAAIVYPEQPTFPPFGTPTNRRSLFYRSSLHSGELNILRMCNPAWRPYCGVRYIKFDDEIWDQSIDEVVPPTVPPFALLEDHDTLNIFDIENNLIGFQGGVKYDIWQFGRRFSLQGFMNGGVYYNKAKWTNQQQEFQVNYLANGTVTAASNSDLTIAEESNVAYVGEASLTAVCRLNKCWACRAGYQVLFIDGLHLASDAYLNSTIDDRSMIFHGWHAGIECRR